MKCKYLPVAVGKSVGIDEYPNFHASGSIEGDEETLLRQRCFARKMRKLYLQSAKRDL